MEQFKAQPKLVPKLTYIKSVMTDGENDTEIRREKRIPKYDAQKLKSLKIVE